MQALVYSLLDVFDATRDLYQTLTNKEQRDYEQNLRIKGYPVSRRIEYVKDERLGSDETIGMDRSTVTRQFEIGYQALGVEYAVGDGMSSSLTSSSVRLAKEPIPIAKAFCPYKDSYTLTSSESVG
jgi:hypothetical protein